MSYSLDIYNNKINPTKDFISFSSFVAFFPQLVAGPIERASNLLPQILNKRNFSYRQGVDGLRLILWGMFKKVVIADSLAPYVNDIFSNYYSFDGGTLLLGLLYFSFQIYCDFSGYSDIAIGTAKLFGFEIMSNFKFPYFSRGISEFWKRWHISLSSWFRDYLYIPLGGSRASKVTSIRNIVVIFVVSGFWHGASWTFIAWGLIHAILYIPVFISDRSKHTSDIVANNNTLPSANEIFQMLVTFILVMIAWVFFRSDSVIDALKYLYIVAGSFAIPTSYRLGIIYIVPIVFLDWLWRFDERKPLKINNRYLRWALYYILLLLIFGHINSEQEFIYFQF